MSKVIAIVGMGAGVSMAVAKRFAREGFAIAALSRRADAASEYVKALAADGASALAYRADAADPAGLASALADVAETQGAPDVLLYNAAAARHTPLAILTAEQLAADLNISVVGALAAAQAVLPAMKAKGSGTLLFTGGGFAMEPMPALASLGVGKAAIRNLAYSLFADLKDTGVHAATVTIGGVVKPSTAFDPDKIADAFWTLHSQPKGAFEREIVFRG